jgi:hypothetical protein
VINGGEYRQCAAHYKCKAGIPITGNIPKPD